MSVLIKGIDMPTKDDMHLVISPDGYVANEGIWGYGNTYTAVNVPTPHGRLIDAHELKAKKYHDKVHCESAVAVAEIDWAETIIEAEG